MVTQKDRREWQHRRGKRDISKIKYRVAQQDWYCSIAERWVTAQKYRVAAQKDKRKLLHREIGESDSTEIVEKMAPQKKQKYRRY